MKKIIEELMVMISSTEEFSFDPSDIVSDDTVIKELNTIEDITQTDRVGMNLLMSAALNERPNIVEYLIKRGIDVDKQDDYGNTALHYAVQSNAIDVIRILINNGANINAADNNGNTPLVRCTYATPLTVFQALMDNGADPHLKNNYGVSALDVYAAREDIMAIIKSKNRN